MQRAVMMVCGVVVIGLAALMVIKGSSPHSGVVMATDGGDGASVGQGAAILALSGDAGGGSMLDGALLLSDLSPPLGADMRGDAGVWAKLPDGTPVPPLPTNAPKLVRFGVVLVSYAGAQIGPVGEKPNARAKADAKVTADKLAAEAPGDFHAAVQHGDPGSQDDVGRMRAGFLEPSTEYVLFTMPVGAVSPAFDTPRGYWIVKRIE
jgi:hypothetical protein